MIETEQIDRRQSLNAVEKSIVETSTRFGEAFDPMGLNNTLRQLPDIIAQKDMQLLKALARIGTTRVMRLDMSNFTTQQKYAVQRDVGMPIMAIAQLSQFEASKDITDPDDPRSAPDVDVFLPGSSEALLHISRQTGLPPRVIDLIYSGDHTRRFTKTKKTIGGYEVFGEDIFKICDGIGMRQQDLLLQDMLEVSRIDIKDPRFTAIMGNAINHYSPMVDAVVTARRYLASERTDTFFTGELLPFLKPVTVDGKKLEQSGSHMAGVMAIDLTLGIVELEDLGSSTEYAKYVKKNLNYASPHQREVYLEIFQNIQGRSVMSQLLETSRSEVIDSDNAIKRLVQVVHTFRKPHIASTDHSLSQRPEPDKKGSGGGIDVAKMLSEKTQELLINNW